MMPVANRMTTVQAVADTNSRSASELARIGGGREEVPEAAHGLDDLDAEFLADAPDEDLDGVGIAIEVLVVEMLDQFGARHHPPGVMHQEGQQAVFVGSGLARGAVDVTRPVRESSRT